MINIGLIGESPYDTEALMHLLQQRFDHGFRYHVLLRNISGDHLASDKAKKMAAVEIEDKKPELLIVMRDLDGPHTDAGLVAEKNKWYQSVVKTNSKTSLFLLNIYELEALILADIDSAKEYFNTPQLNFKGNVMTQKDPKEHLVRGTNRKYHVSECPKLFKKLRFDVVEKNCSYFKTFVGRFESAIASL